MRSFGDVLKPGISGLPRFDFTSCSAVQHSLRLRFVKRDSALELGGLIGGGAYATAMNGLADQEELRLRFDVLTKTKTPELHRYWTTRDRGATRRLFRLAQEVLHAIEAGVFPPRPGWQCVGSVPFGGGV